MALKDVFKVDRKTFFNPSKWIGFEEVKNTTLAIWNSIQALFFISPEPVKKETFDEAKARLGLTENDIKESENNYFFYALLFFGCALMTFFGGLFFLIKYHSFTGLLLGIATTLIFGSQAFRSHFLYFQITQRRLGCTYEEWKQFLLKELGVGK